jgi:hypothetical protein
VYGQQIPIVEVADTGIPAAAAADRTQAADPLEILFQHSGIVIEVLAVSALALTRWFLPAERLPSGQIQDEKSYETHRVTTKKQSLSSSLYIPR